jgi:hypothetical protein
MCLRSVWALPRWCVHCAQPDRKHVLVRLSRSRFGRGFSCVLGQSGLYLGGASTVLSLTANMCLSACPWCLSLFLAFASLGLPATAHSVDST